MEFKISSGSLLSALQRASGAVGFNSKLLPIIDNFLIEVAGKTLIVSSTNMDLSIVTETDIIEAGGEGSIVMPSTILLESLKSMPDHPIQFQVDLETHIIKITSEYGKYSLNGFAPQDFPEFQELPADSGFDFSCESFEIGFSQTAIAALNDEMKKGMQGVSFKVEDGKVTFAATDAHRLIKNVFFSDTGDFVASVILPRKGLLSALKPLLVHGEDMNIRFNDENIYFNTSKGLLICRLAEGTFPNYEAVIPQNNPNKLYLDRLDFINTLKRVSLYSNQSTYQVFLELSPQSLTISAYDIDFNRSGDEQFPCTYEGEPMTVGFNGRFLVEMLSVLDVEHVRFEILDKVKASLIFPEEQKEGQEITMLVMPVSHRG
nr:DNA polymerase III subunit beta [Saprospiraceae bacterium]